MTTSAVLSDLQPGQVVQTELTLEDFLALEPDTYEPPYLEYEGEGLVRRKMSPNPQHSELQPYLAHLLLNFGAQSGQRLHVYTELRTTTGGRSRLPDVAVYVDRRPRESDDTEEHMIGKGQQPAGCLANANLPCIVDEGQCPEVPLLVGKEQLSTLDDETETEERRG